jgi:type IV secretion system protein VirB5
MKRRSGVVVTVSAVLLIGLVPLPARAQWAVIDVAAIQQLVMQINYWRQQIEAMGAELNQLEETHAALTGGRGMEGLMPLGDAERNYLPRDWAEVSRVLAGQSARYGAMADAVSELINERAVLTPERLDSMTAPMRTSVVEARESAAGLTVMTREAYRQAAERFAALAGLVNAIGNADDAKAIADLQGRIAAEQAMLENEQAKLQVLYHAAEAERWAREQQLRELAIAGHGEFDTRLRPELPE